MRIWRRMAPLTWVISPADWCWLDFTNKILLISVQSWVINQCRFRVNLLRPLKCCKSLQSVSCCLLNSKNDPIKILILLLCSFSYFNINVRTLTENVFRGSHSMITFVKDSLNSKKSLTLFYFLFGRWHWNFK